MFSHKKSFDTRKKKNITDRVSIRYWEWTWSIEHDNTSFRLSLPISYLNKCTVIIDGSGTQILGFGYYFPICFLQKNGVKNGWFWVCTQKSNFECPRSICDYASSNVRMCPIRSPKKKFLVNWPTHISLNPFQITHDTTQIRKKNNQIKFTYYFILCNLKGVQIFLSTEFDSNFTFIINFTQYE